MAFIDKLGIGFAIAVCAYTVISSVARAEDRIIIRDQYGKQVGSITRDPIERDRGVLRDAWGKRLGTIKKEGWDKNDWSDKE